MFFMCAVGSLDCSILRQLTLRVLGSGDKRTAKDNLEFIRQWLKLYPHLASNPFWIAGESYAGRSQPPWSALRSAHS